MNQEKIGKFISKRRKEKNLTQVELANKLGVSDKSISKWENGKCMPDLSLFNPLCDLLDITVNDLMSGEIVDNKNYVNTLGENIVNMVSDIEHKKKKQWKMMLLSSILIFVLLIIGSCFYFYYEIDVKFDERVIACDINDKELTFVIKGQSFWNTYYTIKELNGEKIYFFHSTINVSNKSKSNWEYSQSMARLLEGKEIIFGYRHTLDIEKGNIKVYYTDSSINEVEKADEENLKNIMGKSYLICKRNK